jgi:uncharacterized protein YjiS (DUF1127 family)
MTAENLNMQLVQPCRTQAAPKPSLRAALAAWWERAKQRDELAQLDAWSRRDLGVGDADVWNEVRRPFWVESDRSDARTRRCVSKSAVS